MLTASEWRSEQDRYHEIHFESLVEDGHSTLEGIFTFLGLGNHPDVDAFLRAEADIGLR